MRLLYLPVDIIPGTIVYRLRGYDADNDMMTFGFRQQFAKQLFELRSVNAYEADVILRNNLQTGRTYNMTIYITDGKETTEVPSSVIVTKAGNRNEVFLSEQQQQMITVPEDAVKGRKVLEVIVRKDKEWGNPTFELRGSDKFTIRGVLGSNPDAETVKAEVLTKEALDYEDKSLYVLTAIALNGFKRDKVDTRNIATIPIVVVIDDIPDTAPRWTSVPPITRMPDNLKMGDKVLSVTAQDGDRGNSRPLSYTLGPKNSAWIPYFDIDTSTGEITLKRTIQDVRQALLTEGPIYLPITVKENMPAPSNYPALSSNAEIGLILIDGENNPPEFASDRYVGYIEENSPVYTPVAFKDSNYIPRVTDNDQGMNGTFQLFIEGDDTFEVTPSTASNNVVFNIRVKNVDRLDFETTNKFSFKLVAKEMKRSNPLRSFVDVIVLVKDKNDNKPKFTKKYYEAIISENAHPGDLVDTVVASDMDSGDYGKVKYTDLKGPVANLFNIDENTGQITVRTSNGLNRETQAVHKIVVEARDDNGNGHLSETEFTIILKDTNDNRPKFPSPKFYVGILNNDFSALQQSVIVQAFDNDGPGINSEIVYEITGGRYHSKFRIDETSGELFLKDPLDAEDSQNIDENSALTNVMVRAHDKGSPKLYSDEIPVYIHTQAYMNRTLYILLPENVDEVKRRQKQYQSALSKLTGANVQIIGMKGYKDDDDNRQYTNVSAWAAYSTRSTIDVQRSLRELNSALLRPCSDTVNLEKSKTRLQNDYDVVFWALIVFIILIIIAIIILIIYCCCCGNKCRSKSAASRVYPEEETVLVRRVESPSDQTQRGFERLKRTDRGKWKFEKRETNEVTPNIDRNEEYIPNGRENGDGTYRRNGDENETDYANGDYHPGIRQKYGNAPGNRNNEVLINVDQEPIYSGYRSATPMYLDRRSNDHNRGKVIIVDRNGRESVRQGRIVDEMTEEDYENRIGRFRGDAVTYSRPAARRGARRATRKIRQTPRMVSYEDGSDYYEEDGYYEDDDVGPSASQQASNIDSQSNGEIDDDNGLPERPSRSLKSRNDTSSSEHNENVRFSRHNAMHHAEYTDEGNAYQQQGHHSKQQQQRMVGGETTAKNVKLNTSYRKLEDVDEEEEGHANSAGSRRSGYQNDGNVNSALPRVSEDYHSMELREYSRNHGRTGQATQQQAPKVRFSTQDVNHRDQGNENEADTVREHFNANTVQQDSVDDDRAQVGNLPKSEGATENTQNGGNTSDNDDGNHMTEEETQNALKESVKNALVENSQSDVENRVEGEVTKDSVDTNQPSRYMNWYKSNKQPNESDESKLNKIGDNKEEDYDSGISGNSNVKVRKNPYLEKKSVFTIAYDGIKSQHDLVKNADGIRTPSP
ncbi:Uncharacterised protein g6174 [Pycnogonum litorale]